MSIRGVPAVLVTASLLAAPIVLGGCDTGSVPFVRTADEPERPSYVVLADDSLDSNDELRAEAVRIVGILAREAAAREGTLAASPFQERALAHITWRIDHDFSPTGKFAVGNSYYRELDLTQQAEEVSGRAEELFGSQRRIQGTDILGSLLAAEERFAATEGTGQRVLVLVSNMIAFSPEDGLRFRKQRLTKRSITRLIERLHRAEKIADLTGVCVYIVYGGVEPVRPLTTSQQIGLRRFWQSYFDRTGARLMVWQPALTGTPSCG